MSASQALVVAMNSPLSFEVFDMSCGLLGRKVGMTQVFTPQGEAIPVTVIECGPCVVLQIRTVERDGYSAIQLVFLISHVVWRPDRSEGMSLPLIARGGSHLLPLVWRSLKKPIANEAIRSRVSSYSRRGLCFHCGAGADGSQIFGESQAR